MKLTADAVELAFRTCLVNENEGVLVEGVNVRKKARRRTPDSPQGGIDDIECPLHISNVMLEDKYNARHPEGASEAAKNDSAEKTDES